jgi:hypothetical protein
MSNLKYQYVLHEVWLPKGEEGKKILNRIRTARKIGKVSGAVTGGVVGAITPGLETAIGSHVGSKIGSHIGSRLQGGRLIRGITNKPVSVRTVGKDIFKSTVGIPGREAKKGVKYVGKFITDPQHRKKDWQTTVDDLKKARGMAGGAYRKTSDLLKKASGYFPFSSEKTGTQL